MTQLPVAARLYVASVIVISIALLVVSVPQATFQQPLLFIALLVLSSATAALKVHLPLTTGGSTMSVSYAVDFASLLLLGPHETMLVAAGSAFSQCNVNRKERNPFYRTAFSAACSSARQRAASVKIRVTASPPRRSARSSDRRAISTSSASPTASAFVAQTSRHVSAGLDASRVVSTRPRPANRNPSSPVLAPITSISALAVNCGRWLKNAIT